MPKTHDRGKFEYRGKTYSYVSCLVDTNYGPEMRLEIREYGDRTGRRWTYQECASVAVMLSWFKAMLDEYQELIDEETETDEVEIEPLTESDDGRQ